MRCEILCNQCAFKRIEEDPDFQAFFAFNGPDPGDMPHFLMCPRLGEGGAVPGMTIEKCEDCRRFVTVSPSSRWLLQAGD